MQEQWKDIEGYEGLYKISNFGNVMSFHKNRIKILKKSMVKTPRVNNGEYKRYSVTLCKDHIKAQFSVHRLVGKYFVDGKTDNRNVINHIDCNPSNNHYTNLEWCTYKENSHHANVMGRLRNKGVIKEKKPRTTIKPYKKTTMTIANVLKWAYLERQSLKTICERNNFEIKQLRRFIRINNFNGNFKKQAKKQNLKIYKKASIIKL